MSKPSGHIHPTAVVEDGAHIGAGVEISSLEGLRLNAFWLHRNLFGRAERPVYLYLDRDQVEIRDASRLWGLTTSAAQEKLQEEAGPGQVQSGADSGHPAPNDQNGIIGRL